LESVAVAVDRSSTARMPCRRDQTMNRRPGKSGRPHRYRGRLLHRDRKTAGFIDLNHPTIDGAHTRIRDTLVNPASLPGSSMNGPNCSSAAA